MKILRYFLDEINCLKSSKFWHIAESNIDIKGTIRIKNFVIHLAGASRTENIIVTNTYNTYNIYI